MKTPIHIEISNQIPEYTAGKKNRSRKQIQEAMKKHGYDEDFVETVDDRFCQGFGTARDIIVEMLKTRYWDQRGTEKQTEGNAGNESAWNPK